jgi:hypothetical protein
LEFTVGEKKSMPDMTLIAGTVSSLKSAYDFSKTLLGIRDAAMLNAKVIELQQMILSAQSNALTTQSDMTTLLEEKRALENQVAVLKTWDETEKLRYELKSVEGVFIYALKPQAQGVEPPHWICAACYGNQKKSVLQRGGTPMNGRWPWLCPSCKTAVFSDWQGRFPVRLRDQKGGASQEKELRHELFFTAQSRRR